MRPDENKCIGYSYTFFYAVDIYFTCIFKIQNLLRKCYRPVASILMILNKRKWIQS